MLAAPSASRLTSGGLIALACAGPRAGAIAAGLAAVYPPLVWIPSYVLSETLYMPLALGCVLLLEGVIETNEDADLGQVALDLAQQKTMLQASYSVFSQLSDLSLVSYIR